MDLWGRFGVINGLMANLGPIHGFMGVINGYVGVINGFMGSIWGN